MEFDEKLKKNFRCPKCRGTGVYHREVSIRSKVKSKILRNHDDRYLYLSCTLCGYTEVYNLKILAELTETEKAPGLARRLKAQEQGSVTPAGNGCMAQENKG